MEEEIFDKLERRDASGISESLRQNPELANAVNEHGQSVFWISCQVGLKDVVEQMLEEPVLSLLDYDLPDNGGRDALDVAEAYKQKEIIELLNPLFGVGEYPEAAPEGPEGTDGP